MGRYMEIIEAMKNIFFIQVFVFLSFSSFCFGQALPFTRNKLNTQQNVKIVFVGDSVTGGFGLSDPEIIDGTSSPRSYASEFAYQLADRYADSNVVLISRSVQTTSSGLNTCVPAETQRYIQTVASPKRTITVIKDGVGGNNIYRYLARISGFYDGAAYRFPSGDNVLHGSAQGADAVFLMFGINDSLSSPDVSPCYPNSFYLGSRVGWKNLQTRGESLAEFANAYSVAIDWTRQLQPSAEIALLTPTWSNNSEGLANYVQQVKAISQQKLTALIDVNVVFVDHSSLGGVCSQGGWFNSASDCFHPNEKGHRAIGKFIFNEAFSFQSGWWSDPVKAGQGIFIDYSVGRFYSIFNIYHLAGRAAWLTSDALTIDYSSVSSFHALVQSPLREYSSGQTLNGVWNGSPSQNPSPGVMTLLLKNQSQSSLNLGSTTIELTKFDFAPGGNRAPVAYPSLTPVTGVWWNPSESGRGWEIEAQGNYVYMNGYMYDNYGNPTWYAVLATMSQPGVYTGTLIEFAGGQYFNGPHYFPYVINSNVGTVELSFINPQRGYLKLPNGRTTQIQRFPYR